MKRLVFHLVLILCITQNVNAQLTELCSLEVNGKEYHNGKILLHDNRLYATASYGLYLCNLDDGNASKWEKLPLSDDVIVDFDVRGDTIISITDSFLIVSTDGGKTITRTSIDVIVPGWNKEEPIVLTSLAIHPHNAMKFYVAFDRGISLTTDGGDSWEASTRKNLDCLYYNPLDENNLIGSYTGGPHGFTYVHYSVDGGVNWGNIEGGISGQCELLKIAFHPTDKNIAIACGLNIYSISYDQGKSWTPINQEDMPENIGILPLVYLDDIVYDSRKDDVLYGADWTAQYEGKVRVLRSVDGGFSWEVFYSIDDASSVTCISLDKNILAIDTSKGNVYLLDVDAVDTSISTVENAPHAVNIHYDLLGRPVANPTRGIYIKDGKKVAIE